MWLWWLIGATIVVAAGWLLLGYRRAEPAGATSPAAVGAATDASGALPMRQRLKAWFSPSTPRVKGPSLWQRFRMSAVGSMFTRGNGSEGGMRLRDRLRASTMIAKLRASETAVSWRARRQAREVQRKIKDRRSN